MGARIGRFAGGLEDSPAPAPHSTAILEWSARWPASGFLGLAEDNAAARRLVRGLERSIAFDTRSSGTYHHRHRMALSGQRSVTTQTLCRLAALVVAIIALPFTFLQGPPPQARGLQLGQMHCEYRALRGVHSPEAEAARAVPDWRSARTSSVHDTKMLLALRDDFILRKPVPVPHLQEGLKCAPLCPLADLRDRAPPTEAAA